MTAALALARRELSSLLRTPAGWIIAALYAFLTTAVFALRTLDPGQPAAMRFFFATAASLLAVVMPAVSMRLLAEEARAGTLEPLLTSPASHGSIIVGKFAGVLTYTALMLLPTLALVVTLIAVSARAKGIGGADTPASRISKSGPSVSPAASTINVALRRASRTAAARA